MIDECGNAVSIDYVVAVYQSEKISSWRVFVDIVSLRVRQARTGIFNDDCAFLDGRGRIDAIGMNLGLPDYQGHLSRLALPSVALTTADEGGLSCAISLLARRLFVLSRGLISWHNGTHNRTLFVATGFQLDDSANITQTLVHPTQANTKS